MNTAPTYEASMHFETVEPHPWTVDFLQQHLAGLGAPNPHVDYRDVESILFCYDQSPNFRYYHGPNHGAFVGQPELPPALASRLSDRLPATQAASILTIAGLFHDVAYKHVDAFDNDPLGTRAWPGVLQDRIGDVAQYTRTVDNDKPIFTTTLTQAGKNDLVTQMMAGIFAVGNQGILHNQGGNEFDSALAAAKFLQEKGAPAKSIIAATAAIAATIPFKPATGINEQGITTDGHMGDLAQRVNKALTAWGITNPEHPWQDTNDIMLLSVHLANRDIAPFVRPDNFAEVVHNGRGVKQEEVPALRAQITTIRALARAAGLERSAPLLYQWLGSEGAPVPPENVPHIYIPRNAAGQPEDIDQAYPPMDTYQSAVEHTRRNSRLASQFFMAHEAGVALTASIATHIGEPDAPVPGIVHAARWHSQARPHGEIFEQLSPDELLVYNELTYGTGQHAINPATPARSPIGGLLFGALGSQGMNQLSSRIQTIRQTAQAQGNLDPFCNPETAANFIAEVQSLIGPDNFRVIITELHRVARYFRDDPAKGKPGRAAALLALGHPLVEY